MGTYSKKRRKCWKRRSCVPSEFATGSEYTVFMREASYVAKTGTDQTDAWYKQMREDKYAFKYYRFTPLKLRNVSAADAASLAEIRLWASNEELLLNEISVGFNEIGKHPEGEDSTKAVDSNWTTKWTDQHMGSILITMHAPVVATNLGFVTSSDHPERDIVQWYLEGSKNMKNWTMLLGQLSDASIPLRRSAATDIFAWKVDCHPGEWVEWSSCSADCSGGNQTRVRDIARQSWNDGECKPVAGFSQVQQCNEQPCEIPIVKDQAPRGSSLSQFILALFTVRHALGL